MYKNIKNRKILVAIGMILALLVIVTVLYITYVNKYNHGCMIGEERYGWTGNPEGLTMEEIADRGECRKRWIAIDAYYVRCPTKVEF